MRRSIAFIAVAALLAAACRSGGPTEVAGQPSRVITLGFGKDLTIRLQTVGAGEYASPPTVIGRSLRFISAFNVGPFNPGGPTQEFHFEGVNAGEAVITFHHTGTNPDVVDTVRVR